MLLRSSDEPQDNRPAVYLESGKWIIRSSAIGSCNLKLALIGNGKVEEFSNAVREAFRKGRIYEEIIKFLLRREGVVICHEQVEVEVELIPGMVKSRGHWDGYCPFGLIINAPEIEESEHYECAGEYPPPANIKTQFLLTDDGKEIDGPDILEIKSAHEDSFDDWLRKGLDFSPTYRLQVDLYCHWARAQYRDPKIGILFVVMCKKTWELSIHHYPEPQTPLAFFQAKAATVLYHLSRLRAGEHVTCPDADKQKFSCPFTEHHVDDPQEVVVVEKEDPDMLQVIVREREIAGEIATLEAEKKQLKPVIKEFYESTGADKVKIGPHTIRLHPMSSVDYSSLRRDHKEFAKLEEEYRRDTSYVRIDTKKDKPNNKPVSIPATVKTESKGLFDE